MITLSSPGALDKFYLYFVYLVHPDLSINMPPLHLNFVVPANEAVQEKSSVLNIHSFLPSLRPQVVVSSKIPFLNADRLSSMYEQLQPDSNCSGLIFFFFLFKCSEVCNLSSAPLCYKLQAVQTSREEQVYFQLQV